MTYYNRNTGLITPGIHAICIAYRTVVFTFVGFFFLALLLGFGAFAFAQGFQFFPFYVSSSPGCRWPINNKRQNDALDNLINKIRQITVGVISYFTFDNVSSLFVRGSFFGQDDLLCTEQKQRVNAHFTYTSPRHCLIIIPPPYIYAGTRIVISTQADLPALHIQST